MQAARGVRALPRGNAVAVGAANALGVVPPSPTSRAPADSTRYRGGRADQANFYHDPARPRAGLARTQSLQRLLLCNEHEVDGAVVVGGDKTIPVEIAVRP